MKYILVAVAGVVVLFVASLFLLARSPHLELKATPAVIGDQTPVSVHLVSPHGLRSLTVAVEQDGKSGAIVVAQDKKHRLGLFKNEPARDFTFDVGKKELPSMHEGNAHVTITAKANDLIGRTDNSSFDVRVVTAPPHAVADGAQHYINQAGVELVTFSTSGYVTDSGVQVGSRHFRSFPLPTDPDHQRFSLFAIPFDLPGDPKPFVFVTNPTGTVGQATFWYKTFPKQFRTRDIELTDEFLNKAVNDIDPNGSGDLLTRFLKINREMRVQNNQQIADMRNETESRWLWNQPFFAILGSREAMFADKRNYIYKGKQVDQQVHLGFDIAGTQHMPIPAANDGRVIWAARLGIYGNCIVIDHGYGLTDHLWTLKRISGQEGRPGQAPAGDRQERSDWLSGRRSPSLHDASGRSTSEPGRVVG